MARSADTRASTRSRSSDRGRGSRGARGGTRAGRGGRGGRRRPVWRGPLILLVTVVVLLGGTLGGLRAVRADESLPGLTVAGVDVGEQTRPELEASMQQVEVQRQERTLVVRRGDAISQTTAGDAGLGIDVAATVDAVMRRGRQANPLLALRDQVRAFFDPAVVAPVESLDGQAFDAWVATVADDLALPPIEGDLLIEAGRVSIIEPQPGVTIDTTALRQLAAEALAEPGPVDIEVPTTTSAPTTDPEALAALARRAEQAISAPVTLTRGDTSFTLSEAALGRMLKVLVPAASGEDEADQTGEVELAIDPVALVAAIPAGTFADAESEPQDARIEIVGGQVQITPSTTGFRFDADAIAAQVLEVATAPGVRTAELDAVGDEADFTTADAEALGIVEQVATFTTEHPCCQSRVTNIQRIADMVDGHIVMPGETFSLNGHVGPRTTDKGFVGGGAISAGEFVEQIGGGVSQFTTTLFNAIFFGGYQIDAFKPHSYYISRYPVGREATLNFDPPVDLRFTNDSPHGVLIDTSHTDTSITVSLWSTEFAEVDTTTGEQYGFREPTEQREENPDLPAGEERVLQSGRQGFSVDISRTIRYVDGRTAERGFTTTYLAEPRIVEVGTGQAQGPEQPTEEPQDDPAASPTPAPTTAPPQPQPQPQPQPTGSSDGEQAPEPGAGSDG